MTQRHNSAVPDAILPAVARNRPEIDKALSPHRRSGATVALVPTMGALHDGHLSLVRRARADCGAVVASLFVNPTQFAPGEDFERYPRDERRDLELFGAHGVDIVYAPGVGDVYPDGPVASLAAAPELADGLCGAVRPGHFDGVVTVVARLLRHCRPDVAYFGEKDYQQFRIIERMVADLGLPVRVVGMPIVREPDGLALSSRNAYLSPVERRIAPILHETLQKIAQDLAPGSDIAAACGGGRAALRVAGFDRVDYLEVREATTLRPALRHGPGLRVFAAAWLGRTRLIDNITAGGS